MTNEIIQNCEDEKIQFLNEVQNLGYLIGIDQSSHQIKFVSNNINEIFDRNPSELISLKLDEVYNFGLNLSAIYSLESGEFLRESITINGRDFHKTIYTLNNFIYIELEELIISENRMFYYNTSEQILFSKSKNDIWEALLSAVQKMIGYDRVMLYQFLEDDSGIVIKEKVNNKLDSYNGLRFPEFDIPQQARKLYLKKKSRLVADVDSPRIKIISETNSPIDLTYTSIRALSPVHIEYVKNSGSKASFSISIVIDNELWGLITCQNSTAKNIPYQIRLQCELLSRLARITYVNFKSTEQIEFQNKFSETAIKLKENLLVEENLKDSISKNLKPIFKLTEADGMAFIYKDTVIKDGETPPDDEIIRIKNWAKKNNIKNFYHSNSFKKTFGEELILSSSSTGVMFSFLDQFNKNFIIWFKKEENLKLNWAGEPQKYLKEKLDDKGNPISYFSPRSSFKFWQEEVVDRSFIWKENEIYVAKEVIKLVIETLHVQSFKIHSLYEQLKEINEELDAFSYTVSHDLRTPLTVMKLNCQMLERKLNENPENSSQVKSVIKEIDKITEMMEEILALSKAKKSEIKLIEINSGEVINKIVNDLKVYYNAETTVINIGSINNVFAEKTMAYEVFLNIIGNAIKYSSKETTPVVTISSTDDKNYICYKITDNGIGIKQEDHDKMFKLFSRMSNTADIKGNGVGLTIAQTMMRRMDGEISFESKEGVGTTFSLKFKKP